MNMDCFMKRFTSVLMNDAHDDTFETLKILTGGTTSPRIAKLLNFAVSQMGENECYVEVGVFNGTTLCSAAYVNGKHCIGIDSYDSVQTGAMTATPPSEIRDRCLQNIKNAAPLARLIEKDFRNVTKEELGFPVAVSFIDGKHDFTDVMANLLWLEPLLADNAILVFDDVNYFEVSRAIFEWTEKMKESTELLAYMKSIFYNNQYSWSAADRFLNNGVCVLGYHRKPFGNLWIMDLENKNKGEETC